MLSFAKDVAKILEAGNRALVYVGEEDFICNWMGIKQSNQVFAPHPQSGNDAWTKSLKWSGQAEFVAAPNKTWTTKEGAIAGSYRSAKGQ